MNEAKVREVLTYCYDQTQWSVKTEWTQSDHALQNIRIKIEELTDDDLKDVSGEARYSIYAVFPDGTKRLLQSNCLNLSQAETRQAFWQDHYDGYEDVKVEIQERKT